MNLIQSLTPQSLPSSGLGWDNPPPAWEPLPGAGLRVQAPARADYFQDPAGKLFNDSAPYLWLNVSGDFVARAHVRPAFTTTYDAGALMVRQDAKHWCKLCFESTDLGPTAAVSVVTWESSDDANGAELTVEDLWLQVTRQDNVFAFHYSLDGKAWRMVRLFRLALAASVKVGLVAQSPIGPGTKVDFLHFSLENRPIRDIRSGT